MVEEVKQTEAILESSHNEKKKPRAKKAKEETKKEEAIVVEEPKVETETNANPDSEKKVEVKKIITKKVAKEIAIANAYSLSISTKQSSAIGKMILRKPVDRAIEMLELVLQEKMAVPMTALEIPHRKRSLMPAGFGGGGRFPKNASKEFINLLKQLKANCETNGVENPVITIAMSNIASRPFRKEGRRAKSTHVHLEARDKTKLIFKKKK